MESLEDFWGVCLDGTNKKVEWNGNDIADLGDDLDENDVEQTLELRQACLGVSAKDERNVVNLTANNGSGESITQSILSMKMGIHEQTQLFLTLFPPITLELVSGTGPIYISGTVTSKIDVESDDDEEGDEEDEEEEIENMSASVSPAVAVNKAAGKKRPADSPVQKPAKAVKVEKKDDKIVKSSVPAKGSKSKKPSEEEDDDEEDGYEDEDEDSEGEDEEAESGEEDEVQAKPVKQKKNAGAQKKTQAIPVTPKSGGITGAKESGKKQGKQESMSIEDVKEKLLKTPTIPKKVDKFNNYISNSYKITDDKIKKQLWEFVQKNRPQS
ncbi:hypothetical protein EMCRGX_G028701 [Ephydatia muelleri]|eukprot:Em0013g813a